MWLRKILFWAARARSSASAVDSLAPAGRVYVESDEPVAHPAWRELRRSRAGNVSYQLLQLAR